MAKYLGKDEIEKLKSAITDAKNVEAGVVITNTSFAVIGSTMNLFALIAASIQQLIDDGIFDEEMIEVMFKNMSYKKDKDDQIKELANKLKEAIKGINDEKITNAIKEALNEEE